MPHGLTIDELLKAARAAVECCDAGGVASKDGPRATGYLAGVEAVVACLGGEAGIKELLIKDSLLRPVSREETPPYHMVNADGSF